jgi:hypothetical protein
MEEGKKCSRCHETKPKTEFARLLKSKDGLKSWCRQCVSITERERKVRNKNNGGIVAPSTKKCGYCKKILDKSQFYKSFCSDGLAPICKSCNSAYGKEKRERYSVRKGVELPKQAACWVCKETLPIECFGKKKSTVRGITDICKDCERVKGKQFREKNKTKDITPPKEKKCVRCKRMLPASSFFLDKTNITWLHNSCKECERYIKVQSKYGITKDEYNEILESQGGVCRCCKRPQPGKKSLFVDHDHKTGKVRAILCVNCNSFIGLIKENLATCGSIIDYLEKAQAGYGIGIPRKGRKPPILPPEQVADILKAQAGRCITCGVKFGPCIVPQLDHNHSTGVIRGYLCTACNMAVGHAHDSVDRLKQLYQLLVEYKQGELK